MTKRKITFGRSRVQWWTVVLLAFQSLLGISNAATNLPPRPNIVVIMADDLGFSDLGCYGAEIATPNLDRLATDGLRLSQFYNTPRCCPTRAALLTGLYSQQAGIGHMMEDRGLPGYRGELNRNTPTLAEQLRLAGYHTMMAGKWHVSHIYFDGKKQLDHASQVPFWDTKDNWPQQRGFDEFYGTIHGVNSYYDPFALVRGNEPTEPETNFYYTDALSAQAAHYIAAQTNRQQPFFLFVSYTAPHWPLQAPEADIAKYRKTYAAGWDAIRAKRHQRQIELGLISPTTPLSPRDERVSPWENVRDKEWEANRMATYAAMVDRMDQGIGRILAQLRTSGVADDTLVMFFSDNGACDEAVQPNWYDVPSKTQDGRRVKVGNNDRRVMAGPDDVWQSYGPPWANVSSTPFRLYKHFAHEGGIASPFIAAWPKGIKPAREWNRETGHIIDIMPTVMELAGASRPTTFAGTATPPLEGRSLVSIFNGQKRANDAPLFWEHEGHRAVRLNQWKLVARHNRDWELYDIVADRTEANNLAATNPEKVKELAALYETWAKRCHVLDPEELPRARPITPAQSSAGKQTASSK
ncbi:MAG: arylsulfatase [Verrucomicrobiota bacterium]